MRKRLDAAALSAHARLFDSPCAPVCVVPAGVGQTNRSIRAGASGGDLAEDSVLAYWKLLRRKKWLVAGCIAVGMLGGLLVALPQTPIYRSRVSLEIQVLNEDFLNRRQVEATAANYAADTYMQTQIKILQSTSLIKRVAQKLRHRGVPKETPGTGPRHFVQSLLRSDDHAPVPAEKALQIAAESINVRGSGMTRVVEVYCESPRPKLTAEFANLLAQEFIDSGVEVRLELSKLTSGALARQVREAKVNLENSEHMLQNKARALGLEFTGGDQNLAASKVQQLQMSLLNAQADRVQKQSRYELTQTNDLESLAEILDDPSVREYRTRLADLQRQSAELGASFTSSHPKMLRLHPQIAVLKADLENQRQRILERIRKDYDAAQRRENLLRGEYLKQTKLVSEQALNGIEYNIARREADTNRQVYDGMMQKVKEAEIATVMQAGNARIIDRAEPAPRPNKPSLPLNAAVGGIGGSMLGVLLALSRDALRRNLVKRSDLPLVLRVPELGVIPTAKSRPPAKAIKPTRTLRLLESGIGNQNESLGQLQRSTELADSFHFTLTSILFSGSSKNSRRVLVLTSPGTGEGKTSVAVNLAIACSGIQDGVLLVDANFKKPELHQMFNLPNDHGLSDLLLSTTPLNEQAERNFFQPTGVPGLSVLTSGSRDDAGHLMFSARMFQVMDWLRTKFERTFIDAPGILNSSGARLLALHSDAAILIVRAGHTTVEAAQAAVLRMAEDRISVLGSILNDWNREVEFCANGSFDA